IPSRFRHTHPVFSLILRQDRIAEVDAVVCNALQRWSMFVITAVFLTSLPASLLSQAAGSYATISGTVLDPDKTAVPNAGVSVRNDLTGATRSTTTAADGHFEVSSLPVGTYTIEVSSPGFRVARSAGLELAANGLESITISLTLASVSQEVVVS